MTTQILPVVEPRAMDACLGIAPGAREVGLAVLTRERLLREAVLNIRKIPSPEGRDRRFRQVVEELVETYGVTRIAVAAPSARAADTSVSRRQVAWLVWLAGERTLPLSELRADRIRGHHVRDGRATNRRLAEELAREYPELAHRVRAEAGVPNFRLEARARYWVRCFLAIGAARVDLDDALMNRLDL